MAETPFMKTLANRLKENRQEITVKQYLRRLTLVNEDKSFRTLSFLRDYDNIVLRLQDKQEATRISYYTAILATLSLFPRMNAVKKKYEKDYIELINKKKAFDESHEKTEQQKKSMIPMDAVNQKREQLKTEVEKMNSKEKLTRSEFDKVLQHLLVEFYTAIPPRRNQDYSYMYVVDVRPDVMDDSKNYLVMTEKKFIFNKYKTAKIYKTQEYTIPDTLMDVIHTYLLRHPENEKDEFVLLVNADGSEVNKTNGITRILNRAFEGCVGATALRHIFLSDKYADNIKERQEIAKAMGHDVSTQAKYVKV